MITTLYILLGTFTTSTHPNILETNNKITLTSVMSVILTLIVLGKIFVKGGGIVLSYQRKGEVTALNEVC